jgi:hypothetical protein
MHTTPSIADSAPEKIRDWLDRVSCWHKLKVREYFTGRQWGTQGSIGNPKLKNIRFSERINSFCFVRRTAGYISKDFRERSKGKSQGENDH